MKKSRTTEAASLFVMVHDGERYVLRRDRATPGLLWQKLQWPSGRWYWQRMAPSWWAALPGPVRDAAIAYLQLPPFVARSA